jgi:hypothetical protein
MAGFVPATADAPALVEWLDRRPFGPVPLALSSWIRLVGDVWLVGTHPEWPGADAADPLVLQVEGSHYPGDSVRGFYADEFQQWLDGPECPSDEQEGFVLPVAPDRLTKANISGGPPYGFSLPDRCADGLFQAELTMPFVSYLNHAFSQGGFGALAPRNWKLQRELAAGLLPL